LMLEAEFTSETSQAEVAVPPEPAKPPAVEPAPFVGDRRTLLPPIGLFVPPSKMLSSPIDVDYKAERIRETLASFNVGARVVGHHCGPVVTQFDVEPDRGVKVRRITELQNDLALALAAPTIRIQAPVPGKPVVGIEIPNSSATTVTLRELLETDTYRSSTAPLRIALGKDVAGGTAIIDLAKMPHLLIAGATGSGKSICINALISCLLYNNTPDQVRLMLVDPKVVELTVYNDVPHLLSPVVTEMDKVVGVLQWAMREMERRYQQFAANGVRNIGRFNEKAEAAKSHKLPYIVLIVDELADLMMVAPEDVEDAICRLAQLARAAGIHLVIATQRPSVDVVTGLIKANFPARIAFQMTSQVDSRTILDQVGAEKLLGRGDMLYQPPDAPKPIRLQGAFLTDQEIERLVEFWKESPLQRATERVSSEDFAAAEKESAGSRDELLEEAARVVRAYQHTSVSFLQRTLRVGYARAARIMDQLEDFGVVGPADGSKQRAVIEHVSEAS
ncbi:MAG: DNA translocase FtsK, partial [Chloroflexota bacterium]|nr:DNA translocase FtsK [Chloroflexota bacterium]